MDATRPKIPNAQRTREGGQALLETAMALLLIFVFAFFFGWILYAHGQARTTALGGARYAAWERTVWQPTDRPESEINRQMTERIIARPSAPVRSAGGRPVTNAELPSFYSLPGESESLVDVERASTLNEREEAEATSSLSSNSAYGFVERANATGRLSASRVPLQENGLHVASVGLNLNLDVLQSLGLSPDSLGITQRAAVVADSWSAQGVDDETAKVRALVPAQTDIPNFLDSGTVSAVRGMFPILAVGGVNPTFRPGCIKADVVPDASARGQSRRNASCR